MIPPVAVHCGLGGVLSALSLPLALRMIPPNRAYGVRIPQAFESEHKWYEINAYGGRLLLLYGLALDAFGWLARDLAPPETSLWMPVFIVVPLLPVFPLLSLIHQYARRLP